VIRVAQSGEPQEDIRRIIHSLHYSEDIRVVSAVGSEEAVAVAPGTVYGGLAVDRSIFRKLQQDARWFVYAAGWVKTDGAHAVTLGLQYEKDNAAVVVLGTLVAAATGAYTKRAFGPFDVFGTAGVPAGETIPIVTLTATVAAGGAGTAFVRDWNLWVRLLPAKQ